MTPRVMIVEDEEPLSLMLRYNLEAEGYSVDTVERGDEAETRLRENIPDLVLLDWMLPGLSGIELCRRLRSREATRSLPIIMLTARGEENDRIRGLDTGAGPDTLHRSGTHLGNHRGQPHERHRHPYQRVHLHADLGQQFD